VIHTLYGAIVMSSPLLRCGVVHEAQDFDVLLGERLDGHLRGGGGGGVLHGVSASTVEVALGTPTIM
jgi:hypothetical protein